MVTFSAAVLLCVDVVLVVVMVLFDVDAIFSIVTPPLVVVRVAVVVLRFGAIGGNGVAVLTFVIFAIVCLSFNEMRELTTVWPMIVGFDGCGFVVITFVAFN